MAKIKRAFPRIKRRVNCSLTVRGSHHVGVVVDLSPKGFFVQTSADADIGADLAIVLQARSGEAIEITAKVTNRRQIPRQLMSVAKGGLGCRINGAPEDYYHLLANIRP